MNITSSNHNIIVLILAATIDYFLGDPKQWIHPTMVMGIVIRKLTQWSLSLTAKQEYRRYLGIFLNLLLVLGSGLIAWLVVYLSHKISSLIGIIVESIFLSSCFATRSLRNAAEEVLQASQQSVFQMRRSLSQYVGRDTKKLTMIEGLRALLETVAENTTDGVTAPLFYALLGGLLMPIGPASLAISYKAISTLDSMIGYKKEPYTYLGWFSARLEDHFTWIPCRLTVLTLALLSGKPKDVMKICLRDGPKDPSPNSGWSESVYAAILNIQLGGTNYYQGIKIEKPLLGEDLETISIVKVNESLQLMRNCFIVWLIIGIFIISVLN